MDTECYCGTTFWKGTSFQIFIGVPNTGLSKAQASFEDSGLVHSLVPDVGLSQGLLENEVFFAYQFFLLFSLSDFLCQGSESMK